MRLKYLHREHSENRCVKFCTHIKMYSRSGGNSLHEILYHQFELNRLLISSFNSRQPLTKSILMVAPQSIPTEMAILSIVMSKL